MSKVTSQQLQKKCNEFKELEGRGTFYDIALNLLNKGFEIEAFFLILATWNFAMFRYVVKEFDINSFKEIIKKKCNPIFEKLRDKELKTVNFDEIEKEVKEIYTILSDIKGVKYTGASKLMHLKNPNLFIMWDSYIKRNYGFYKGTAEDYINFLKKMQDMFKGVAWNNKNKTLAKAIDEYNYVTITLPEMKRQKDKGRKNE
jgi:hypothetical protein